MSEIAIVLFVAGAAILAALAVWGLWPRAHERGAPAPEILDNTEPLAPEDMPGNLTRCPHDVPLSKHCERCDGVLRGRHITLDGEDDGPRVPPPPPVGPKDAA